MHKGHLRCALQSGTDLESAHTSPCAGRQSHCKDLIRGVRHFVGPCVSVGQQRCHPVVKPGSRVEIAIPDQGLLGLVTAAHDSALGFLEVGGKTHGDDEQSLCFSSSAAAAVGQEISRKDFQ